MLFTAVPCAHVRLGCLTFHSLGDLQKVRVGRTIIPIYRWSSSSEREISKPRATTSTSESVMDLRPLSTSLMWLRSMPKWMAIYDCVHWRSLRRSRTRAPKRASMCGTCRFMDKHAFAEVVQLASRCLSLSSLAISHLQIHSLLY